MEPLCATQAQFRDVLEDATDAQKVRLGLATVRVLGVRADDTDASQELLHGNVPRAGVEEALISANWPNFAVAAIADALAVPALNSAF